MSICTYLSLFAPHFAKKLLVPTNSERWTVVAVWAANSTVVKVTHAAFVRLWQWAVQLSELERADNAVPRLAANVTITSSAPIARPDPTTLQRFGRDINRHTAASLFRGVLGEFW
jgi:hypothetical protein